MAFVGPRRISDIKPLFGNLALSSHYQVIFGGFSSELQGYLSSKGVDGRFLAEDAGLLCFSASLPGSSLATADINGNFTGVNEKMAHTRMFTQISLDFYVDTEYKELKFLEHWIEYIASGSGVSQERDGYFFRMRYPSKYKLNSTKIVKFDRNYGTQLEYTFYGLFPIALDAVPVSYQGSDLLRASATFNYDRYVCGRVNSLDIFRGNNNNNVFNLPQQQSQNNPRLIPRSPGSVPSNGVEFVPSNQSLYEYLYGKNK